MSNNKSSLSGLRRRNDDFFPEHLTRKLRCYGDVIHSFDWKSAVEHDGGV